MLEEICTLHTSLNVNNTLNWKFSKEVQKIMVRKPIKNIDFFHINTDIHMFLFSIKVSKITWRARMAFGF